MNTPPPEKPEKPEESSAPEVSKAPESPGVPTMDEEDTQRRLENEVAVCADDMIRTMKQHVKFLLVLAEQNIASDNSNITVTGNDGEVITFSEFVEDTPAITLRDKIIDRGYGSSVLFRNKLQQWLAIGIESTVQSKVINTYKMTPF